MIIITYKIILIGDSSVGKTCLFKKLTSGTYSDKNISTIGVDRKTFITKVKNPGNLKHLVSKDYQDSCVFNYYSLFLSTSAGVNLLSLLTSIVLIMK